MGESLTLDPDHGLAASVATALGTGFGKASFVELFWDAGTKPIASGTAASDGSFKIAFTVPADAKGGAHAVKACATYQSQCDAGSASAAFTVDVPATPTPPPPKPTPKPTARPTPPATIRPSASAPGPSQTPATTAGPGFSIPPLDVGIAPLPWLNAGNGTCTSNPIPAPSTTVDWDTTTTNPVVGVRAAPPMGAHSGTMALSSSFDDFGSGGHPIVWTFPTRTVTQLALFVGREAPPQDAGPLTAILTGYAPTAAGLSVVASARTTLEPAAIPISRCLHITAPAGLPFSSISVEYVDEDGNSAYERRWVDDITYPTVSGPAPSRPPGAFTPMVTVITPTPGTVLAQPTTDGVHVIASIRSNGGQPTVHIAVNGGNEADHPVSQADASDPGLWRLDVILRDGLHADTPNTITLQARAVYETGPALTTDVTFRPPVEGDVWPVAIEVNQAVQEPGNGVPLIGGKRTVVRVFLRSTVDSRGPWGPVTGTLVTHRSDGTSATHLPALGPSEPLTGAPDRFATTSQLVFLLDPADVRPGELGLEVHIRPLTERPQTDAANDTLSTRVTFLEPIYYTAYGVLTSFPDGQTNDWSTLQGFVPYIQNVFPVTHAQVIPVPGVGTTPQMVTNIDGLRDLTWRLLARLPPNVSIFGLWPGTSAPSYMCDTDGVCEAGLAYLRRTDGWGHRYLGPSTMAQELAHAEGLMWHAETWSEPAAPPFPFFNPAWPWWHTGIGHPGMDTQDAINPVLVAPYVPPTAHMHDFMSYAGASGLIESHWVSPYTYCELLDHFTGGDDRCSDAVKRAGGDQTVELGETTPRAAWQWDGADATGARLVAYQAGGRSAGRPVRATGAEQAYLSIEGSVAWDGTSGVIAPLETVRRAGPVAFDAVGDAFELRIVDAAGRTLFSTPFTPTDTHHVDGTAQGFAFLVPAPAGAHEVQMLRGDQVIALRTASAHAPTVALVTDLQGVTLSEPSQLTWQAADADGDAVTASLELSDDDGATWLPIAVGVPDGKVTLDPATLPGGGSLRIRIEVSDGFLGTTVTTGTFSIARHAPTVTITAPAAELTVAQARPVALEASAFDLEDIRLDDAAVAWTSDRDGALGTGAWILAEHLSVGAHVVTATVTDRDGMSASATVRITVVAGDGASPAAAPSAPSGAASGAPWLAIGVLAVGLAVVLAVGGALLLRRRRAGP